MSVAAEPVQLRPLGLGEIFDRAVTLYVRNIVPLTIIALVVVLPLTVAQYLATGNDTTYQQLLSQIQHPGKPPAAAVTRVMPGWMFLYFTLAVLLAPFATVAIAAAAGAIYRGQEVDWRAAYATALRHWGAVLLTIVCEIVLLVSLIFSGAIVLGIAFGIAFVLVRFVAAAGVVLFIFAGICAFAFLLFMILFYLAFGFSFNAIGIEELPFNKAISRGFARIFNRTELGRASVIALALVAVYLGLMIVSMSVAGIFMGLVHLTALNSIVQGIVTLISTAFLGLLVAVYYFDVRVRREGLDMQADIDRLGSTATT
jgi:hypothetical protein